MFAKINSKTDFDQIWSWVCGKFFLGTNSKRFLSNKSRICNTKHFPQITNIVIISYRRYLQHKIPSQCWFYGLIWLLGWAFWRFQSSFLAPVSSFPTTDTMAHDHESHPCCPIIHSHSLLAQSCKLKVTHQISADSITFHVPHFIFLWAQTPQIHDHVTHSCCPIIHSHLHTRALLQT